MPQYAYRAINADSQVTTGILVAETQTALERRITDLGLWLIEAKVTTPKAGLIANIKVSREDLVDFFNSLATLIDAGIDIAESLRVIVSETEQPDFQKVLETLRINIESGVAFSEAMAAHPSVFSREVCNLIHAGEQSGKLVETCKDISAHLEWVDQLMADIKQATLYPALIATAVMGLVFIMFSFVVPQFSTIFDSLDLDLPKLTQIVVTVGEFSNAYWWAILLGAAGIAALLKFGPRYSPTFAYKLDEVKFALPIFGELNRLLAQSAFAHNMALILNAGVPIVQGLALVKGIVGNRVMERALGDAESAVTEGRRMSESLSEAKLFSPLVMRMIVVGEETGRLDFCLQKVASRMDTEIPRRIKRLFGILEPMIIMTLIGIVGVVAGAIFLPLFSLMSGIN